MIGSIMFAGFFLARLGFGLTMVIGVIPGIARFDARAFASAGSRITGAL
jgi:hypothetical protein